MSGNGEDIDCPRGVTPELWKTLDELWGSEIVGPLRKLRLVRNHKGPYRPCTNPPKAKDWNKGKPNDNIELLEARYGSITDISSGKPSVWFVVKHRREEDNGRLQLSERCHLRIWIQFLTANDNGTEDCQNFDSERFIIRIIKPTLHGTDLYVLLEMIMEESDWIQAGPVLQASSRGRIGPGERLVVHLQDSLPSYGYRCAIWQADVNWL